MAEKIHKQVLIVNLITYNTTPVYTCTNNRETTILETMQEKYLSGLRALEATITLLRQVRRAHPTKGLFEAADFQWWWRTPRPTDTLEQLFWFDDSSLPIAAVMLTDWGDSVAFDPLLMPDATPEYIAHILETGFAHAAKLGLTKLHILVDTADSAMLHALGRHGYRIDESSGKADVETWLEVGSRAAVSPIHAGYRLFSRSQMLHRPHHMIGRGGLEIEARLRQTSLYRADLDLVVLAEDDSVAAYGLFWYDPETKTGLVEPMRTEERHQRKGLARHVLTTGLERLALAGAERVKIIFNLENEAARDLYLGVGFQPVKQTVMLSRMFIAMKV